MPNRIPTGEQQRANQERLARYRREKAASGVDVMALSVLRDIARLSDDWQYTQPVSWSGYLLDELVKLGMIESRRVDGVYLTRQVRVTQAGKDAIARADATRTA